ncbi:protein kinase domain-containing protein [Brunnivagina elsteri]|uniref:histidine kinase n=1 Tax=Brunnivagina elsteri CCALA 953 TaxID=987040 RepID=A0A2A2TJD8_9CYAN|nr:AAA family ATPase [Calothrix elsteri]PAX54339.1 histidine kinase [Calothrix elsteri CCALA 953]
MTSALTIPGYEITEVIDEAENRTVCRAKCQKNQHSVILKVLKAEYSTLEQISRIKHEYQTTKNLNLDGVVKVYGLETFQNYLVLVAEDFGGISLKEFISIDKNNRLAINTFLSITVQLAKALASLHTSRVIHKDIKPSNIIINSQTGEVKITDFSIASRLSQQTTQLLNTTDLEGTLAYMSPEQTGRMNRCIDYRTDFYSLGVTFYELLTGKLPFNSEEALEIVYGHIAKIPIPAQQLNPSIPNAIAAVIAKLMAKNAEDRYQSASGLLVDLQQCWDEYQESGIISDFVAGECDRKSQLNIPQKLYGREREIEQLSQAFARVNQGSCELVQVSGYSGVGKSLLVNQTITNLTHQRGYFVCGKFDQFQRDTPLSVTLQILRSLISQILIESLERLEEWKEKLLKNLNGNAQIIINVIPELELLIGEQPTVPKLSPTEELNRYIYTLSQCIQVFADTKHPLVIFMDDTQWIDTASLQILQLLMSNPESRHLLIITSYRDNETSCNHPFIHLLETISTTGVARIESIKLKPLTIQNVQQLIAETLDVSIENITLLSKLLFDKTQGNPFFLTQLIKSLYSDRLLKFDYKDNAWIWDIEQIKNQNITDNVVDLMIDKFQKLPSSTQQVLQLAACVGNQFDLQTIVEISSNTSEQVMEDIWDTLQLDLIVPLNNDYRLFFSSEIENKLLNTKHQPKFKFACDRIQEAAYNLITQSRQEHHWQIGELLLKNTEDEDLEASVFEIVNHLNAGLQMVLETDKKTEIAKLNLIAGCKAKGISAYDMALKYLNLGIDLLNYQTWQSNYELILALHENAIEAAYLCADYQLMEQLAATVITNAKIPLDTVKVYENIIQASTAQNKPLQAIKIAKKALQQFGLIFPEQPTESDVEESLQVIAELFKNKHQNIEDLVNLPMMVEPNHLATIQLLSSVTFAAYITAPTLAHLITLKQVELLVKFGNAPSAAFCYSCYGMLLMSIQQDIETADKFGKLALTLAEKNQSQSIKSMTYYVVAAFINHGKAHIKDSLQLLQTGYQAGLEGGNAEFLGYCLREICHHLYLIGDELVAVEQKLDYIPQVLANLKQERTQYSYQTIWQSVQNWLGKSNDSCILVGEAGDENKLLPVLSEANELEGFFHLYLRKLILCCGFGDFKQAVEIANQARKYLAGGMSFCSVPFFYYYDSLAILATLKPDSSDTKNLLQQVSENQDILQKWSQHAPMNYQHKYDLIEAEKYHFLGQKYQAMEFYDLAISGALENGYIQDTALANERAGEFYLALGKSKIAPAYIWEAYNSYMRWGAKAKIHQLEKQYSQIIKKYLEREKGKAQSTLTNTKGSTTTSQQCLDLATVMKASQAISSEIVLDKLLYNLLHIILENSSAQKGCIILERNKELFIEVADNDEDASEIKLQSIKVDSSEDIPISIINYVARTHKSLVLNNASLGGNFQTESYIAKQQTKSLLCTPILYQGKFIGIVYLENNLVTDAFSKDRLQIIQILTSQAAIAIENAKLFAREQEKSQQLAESFALLAQKEEQSRGIFENTIDGLSICDLETGQLIAVNTATTQMYGYTSEEWLHLQPADFVHPDYLHCFSEFMETVKAGKEFFCEVVTIAKDGTLFDVEVKANGIQYNGKLHGLSVTRNTTDRKRAEKVLKQQEEQYRGIFEAVNDGLSIIDIETGEMIATNPAYAGMHGYSCEEILQLNPSKYIHPDSVPLFRECIIKTSQGEQFECEAVSICKDGTHYDIEVKATPFTYNGKPSFLAIARDISERKRAENIVKQERKNLEIALDKLQRTQSQLVQTEKISQLGQLVAGVAHEVNNPVGFINGNLNHAKQYIEDLINLVNLYQENFPNPGSEITEEIENVDLDFLKEDLPKMISSMKFGTDRIRDIMRSLRNFSRTDASEKRPVDIHENIDTTLIVLSHRLKSRAERPAIQIIKEYGNIPPIPCFSGQLNQVFMNLLANAIDALDESNAGKKYLEIEKNPNIIKITTSTANNLLTLRIADNGSGIPEAVIQKLFEAFFTTKPEGKGTGLGLSISYQIITEAHGGKLECISSPGNGTEFVIQIPI